MRVELDKMTKEDFYKTVEAKWGKERADLVMGFQFDDYVRIMFAKTLDAEIKLLEG